MTINWFVGHVVPGIRQSTAVIYLRNSDSRSPRRAEIVVQNGAASFEEGVRAVADDNALWAQGTEVDNLAFLTANALRYKSYYTNILVTIEQAKQDGNTLDGILAAANGAVNQIADQRKAFDEWRAMITLKAEDITDQQTKRDLLLTVWAWAASNISMGS